MKRFRKLTQAGDTIVEVLIALAIIGVTLGSSYGLAHKSQQAGRYAQERTEAQKLAEGQFEKLKSLAPDSTKNIFDASHVFCIDPTLNRKDFANAPPDNLTADDFSTYPAECKSSIYNIAVKNVSTTNDQFRVTVRWDRLGGGKDEVSMQYRTHYISTASPLGPLVLPIPLAPSLTPSGSLSCNVLSNSTIKLDYSFSNGSSVSIFRGDTLLQTALLSPSNYTDGGLDHGTTYTYNLRNGTNTSNTLLDSKTCTTLNPQPPPPPPPSVSGTISSCTQPGDAFDNVYINYSFSGVSSVNLLRSGTFLATLTSPSGTYTDYNPNVGGNFEYGTAYRYTLNSGSAELAHCDITTQTFNIDLGGLGGICWTGCH